MTYVVPFRGLRTTTNHFNDPPCLYIFLYWKSIPWLLCESFFVIGCDFLVAINYTNFTCELFVNAVRAQVNVLCLSWELFAFPLRYALMEEVCYRVFLGMECHINWFVYVDMAVDLFSLLKAIENTRTSSFLEHHSPEAGDEADDESMNRFVTSTTPQYDASWIENLIDAILALLHATSHFSSFTSIHVYGGALCNNPTSNPSL